MGGFLTLQVGGKNNPKVDDITGLAWLDDDLLVYTVSPIYGIPGLYLFDCSNYVTARLVPPHNSSYTSPEDKDYFELFGVEKNRAFTIRYYYSSDVSKTDFSAFRARENLKTFMLDMTGGPALIRSH